MELDSPSPFQRQLMKCTFCGCMGVEIWTGIVVVLAPDYVVIPVDPPSAVLTAGLIVTARGIRGSKGRALDDDSSLVDNLDFH